MHGAALLLGRVVMLAEGDRVVVDRSRHNGQVYEGLVTQDEDSQGLVWVRRTKCLKKDSRVVNHVGANLGETVYPRNCLRACVTWVRPSDTYDIGRTYWRVDSQLDGDGRAGREHVAVVV